MTDVLVITIGQQQDLHLLAEWEPLSQCEMDRFRVQQHCLIMLLKLQVRAETQAPSLLQKLGRVLREKTAGDIERVFKGTSKTREKLGVSFSPTLKSNCSDVPWHQRRIQNLRFSI